MLFSRNKKKIKKITCLSAIFAGVLSSASFLSSCSDQLKPEVNSILLSTDADKEITGIICEQGEFDPNFNIVFDDIDGVPIDDNIDKVYYEFENNPYPKNIKIDKDSGVISWAFGQSFSNIGLDVCAVLQTNTQIISNDVHFELNTTFEKITEIELEYKGSYNLDGTKGVSGASDNKIFHSFLPTNADQTTPIKSNLTPSVDSKQFTSEDIYIQDDYIKWSDNLDAGTYKFNISYQTMDGEVFKSLQQFTLNIVYPIPYIKEIKLNWVNQSGSTTSEDLYGFVNREGTSYPEHTKVTINPSDASSSSLAWSCWTSNPDIQLDFDPNSGIIYWSQIPSYLSNESLPVFIKCYDKDCPSTSDTIQLNLHIRSDWTYIGSEYFAGEPDFLIDQPQPISQSNGVSTCYWSISNFSYSLDPVDPSRLAVYLRSGEYVPYAELLTSGLVRNLSLNFNFNIRLATGESFDTPISISDEEIANNFGKFTIDTNKISPRLFSPYDENVTEKLWQHVMHYIYRYFCYDYKFNFVTSINGVKNSFYSLKDCVEVRYDMTHQVFTTRINTKNVPLVTMGDFKISFKLQSIDRESFVLLRDVTGSPEDLNPIAYYQEYTESITTYVGTISTITPSFEIYSYNN